MVVVVVGPKMVKSSCSLMNVLGWLRDQRESQSRFASRSVQGGEGGEEEEEEDFS